MWCFFFPSAVDLASNAWQLCDSNLEADYHDRFLQGLLRNEFSLSSVDLSKTCVERCKTSEPFNMIEIRSVETSGTAYPVMQDHVPEGRIPLVQRCEIPKARTACPQCSVGLHSYHFCY